MLRELGTSRNAFPLLLERSSSIGKNDQTFVTASHSNYTTDQRTFFWERALVIMRGWIDRHNVRKWHR